MSVCRSHDVVMETEWESDLCRLKFTTYIATRKEGHDGLK